MEGIIKGFIGISGGAVSYLFGGWSGLMVMLVAFVIADYFTGITAAATEGKLKSSIGLVGIARKVFIFVIVAMANLVGNELGQGILLRDATICFYLVNEFVSIVENVGRIGLPVPEFLVKAVEVLKKNKTEDKQVAKDDQQ